MQALFVDIRTVAVAPAIRMVLRLTSGTSIVGDLDAKAKEAFQALSEAFEQLSSDAGQAQLLRAAGAATARPSARRRAAAAQPQDDTKVKFTTRKVRGYVFAAERSVEHLDRQKGLPESLLWPPESTQAARDLEEEVNRARQTELYPGQANEMLPDYRERLELNEPGLALQRLLELMTHLRTVHLYCLYCGCTYDSAEDMERNCPGVTEEEHDEAKSMGLRDSATARTGAEEEQPGEDPLETFMASRNANGCHCR
eukprot:s74_g12.t1